MDCERFPPERRLRTRRDFRQAFGQGRVVYTGVFSVVFRRNEMGFSRLGIAIRKAVGNAPLRNRLKRWIREAFRRNAHVRSLSLDIVVTMKRPLADIDFHEIQNGFQLFLRKLP